MMYTLDFETIKLMMQNYRQTGLLSAEVPSGVGPLREPCRIEVSIVSGLITSCTVVGSSGRNLMGKAAIQELSRLGRLRWTLAPSGAPSQEKPAQASGVRQFFPRRAVARLPREQTLRLSRVHRGVFALADGTKSVGKIAEILSVPQQLVDQALRDLQAMGAIVFEQEG